MGGAAVAELTLPHHDVSLVTLANEVTAVDRGQCARLQKVITMRL